MKPCCCRSLKLPSPKSFSPPCTPVSPIRERRFEEDSAEVSVFPGWEFFAPVAGAKASIFDLLTTQNTKPRVFVEEPAMVKNQGERWWNKVEQRHERAGIGSLIRAEDIYLSPWDLEEKIRALPGCDLDQLGTVDVFDADTNSLSEVEFSTRPTQRFHGSIPALIEQLKSLMAQDARILLTAPHQGEVERLASMLQEYGVPYRLGSRTQHAGSETIYDESSYLAGDVRTPVIVKTPMANGVQVLDIEKTTARMLVIFGAQDLVDDADVSARRITKKSKTSAFLSDFRDLAVGDYVVTSSTASRQYMGSARDPAGRRQHRVHDPRVRRAGAPLHPAHAPRPHPEVPLHRRRPGARTQTSSATRSGPKQKHASRRPCRIWPTSC